MRLDIADCALRQLLDHFSPGGGGVVSLGKHLCGAATDLALQSIASAFAVPPGGGGAGSAEGLSAAAAAAAAAALPHTFAGLGIALCCHHACNFEDYVGKAWWREVLEGSAVEFEAAKYLSSWALLEEDREGCRGGGGSSSSSGSAGASPALPDAGAGQAGEWVLALPTALKARIGRAAKRAIDAGRLAFCAASGLGESVILHYCSRRVCLENALLLVTPRR